MVESRPTEFPCPRCGVALFEGRSNDVTLCACGSCGGVWLDNEVARRLVRACPPEAERLADLAADYATVLGVPAGPADCPVCRATMRRVMVPPTSVEVDACDAHGTWFDRRELQAVVAGTPRPAPPPDALPSSPGRTFFPPTPAPTAREIARELYAEQRRQEQSRAIVIDLFGLLTKR